MPVYVFQIETRLLMSHEPLRFELLYEFDDEPQICHLAESRRPDGATESGAAARPTPSAHQGGFLKWAQFLKRVSLRGNPGLAPASRRS